MKKAGVREMIRFSTVVKNVERKDGKFTVTVRDLPNDTLYSEVFDHVIVCNGHFSDWEKANTLDI